VRGGQVIDGVGVKRILLWLFVAAVIVIGYAVYRSRNSSDRLNVTPDAGREIEKAKGR
jgi:hypothetical protein